MICNFCYHTYTWFFRGHAFHLSKSVLFVKYCKSFTTKSEIFHNTVSKHLARKFKKSYFSDAIKNTNKHGVNVFTLWSGVPLRVNHFVHYFKRIIEIFETTAYNDVGLFGNSYLTIGLQCIVSKTFDNTPIIFIFVLFFLSKVVKVNIATLPT